MLNGTIHLEEIAVIDVYEDRSTNIYKTIINRPKRRSW